MLDIILEQNRLQTSHYADQDFSDYGHISVASAMKEYATWYAKECLKIAAEKAMVIKTFYSSDSPQIWDTTFEESSYVQVYKDSILNIQLPEHDKTL